VSFWGTATVCKRLRTMLSDRCTVCPVCLSLTLVYCGQTVEWIKMLLGTEVGLGPGDIVLDGDPDSPKRGHNSPRFSVHVCGGQTARRIKRPLGTEVGLSPGHIVLGPSSPAPKGAQQHPHFSAHVSFGHTIRPPIHLSYC